MADGEQVQARSMFRQFMQLTDVHEVLMCLVQHCEFLLPPDEGVYAS